MIDLSVEKPLTTEQAAAATGTHRTTIFRWYDLDGERAKAGLPVLRSGRLGSKRVTSVEALNEFQAAFEKSLRVQPTPVQSRRDVRAALRSRHGIG